ncbi:hypothetical protein E2C01_090320 [Portunus trituberculatus]|uniref:Uncharacterized protein n=1 Tax=Portunus trituberculatus TaxID=210409 RepID=A0A5B7JRX1_PORTR|nr:hypothetical protein [Portunus trituberculatus]
MGQPYTILKVKMCPSTEGVDVDICFCIQISLTYYILSILLLARLTSPRLTCLASSARLDLPACLDSPASPTSSRLTCLACLTLSARLDLPVCLDSPASPASSRLT